jgi:hypothetical protein
MDCSIVGFLGAKCSSSDTVDCQGCGRAVCSLHLRMKRISVGEPEQARCYYCFFFGGAHVEQFVRRMQYAVEFCFPNFDCDTVDPDSEAHGLGRAFDALEMIVHEAQVELEHCREIRTREAFAVRDASHNQRADTHQATGTRSALSTEYRVPATC